MVAGALLFLLILTLFIIDFDMVGLEYHEAATLATEPAKLIQWVNFGLVVPLLYLAVVSLPKLMSLAIHKRIFNTRHTMYLPCCIVFATWIANTLAASPMSSPLQFFLHKTRPHGWLLLRYQLVLSMV